ncbi:MAG: hypothetical protein PVH03_01335 [Chloroflexota bacterium]|jgi:hypothetical protein
MLESPWITDETITEALLARYGLSVNALTFLPIGNDSASWAYRVQTIEGRAYFLKIRANKGFSQASLAIPCYLRDQGVPHIIAPLSTNSQTLWVRVKNFALSLYSFVDGQIGANVGLSEQQWRAFGALMKQSASFRVTAGPRLTP